MRNLLLTGLLLLISVPAYAQEELSFIDKKHFSMEASVGGDLFLRGHLNGLVKYNIRNNISVGTQTNIVRSYRSMGEVVDISPDDFKSINLSIAQRIGAGVAIGKERFNHTFLLMAGPRYYRLRETHSYSNFEDASTTVSTWIPDVGFLYNLKIGKGKKYFTTQLSVPFLLIPDNLMGVSLSFGIGFQ